MQVREAAEPDSAPACTPKPAHASHHYRAARLLTHPSLRTLRSRRLLWPRGDRRPGACRGAAGLKLEAREQQRRFHQEMAWANINVSEMAF